MNKVKVLNADGINHSNMINASDHQLRKTTQTAFKINAQDDGVIQVNDGGVSYLDEIDEEQ